MFNRVCTAAALKVRGHSGEDGGLLNLDKELDPAIEWFPFMGWVYATPGQLLCCCTADLSVCDMTGSQAYKHGMVYT